MRRLHAPIRFQALCAFSTLTLLAACAADDSDSSGGDGGGQEVGRDFGNGGADLGPGPDAGDMGGGGDTGGVTVSPSSGSVAEPERRTRVRVKV